MKYRLCDFLYTQHRKMATGLQFPRKRSVTDVLPCTFQPFTTKLVRQSQISRGRVFAGTRRHRHPVGRSRSPDKRKKTTNAERQTQHLADDNAENTQYSCNVRTI
uniref:Uncharacterized protein n=1 Tax=Graphocephala atropunctata TaxID=36148 RepID=A0A1B6MRC7_9HEMI